MSVSVVIPTRNRRYAIEKTIDSYIEQEHVKEIIFVDDAGEDDLGSYITEKGKTTQLKLKYLRHDTCKGAAAGRNTGLASASCEYVLFGEDDVYLENNYIENIIGAISNKHKGRVLVSGRIIMLKRSESLEEAMIRFENGMNKSPVLDKNTFTINFDSIFKDVVTVPFTHAIFMGRRDLLLQYGFDEFYFPGNGYREESDLQMKNFCDGGETLILNNTHCFHMARSEVRSGGQRMNRIRQYLYCIKYNSYFFNKYYMKASSRLGMTRALCTAKFIFSITLFFKMFISPFLRLLK